MKRTKSAVVGLLLAVGLCVGVLTACDPITLTAKFTVTKANLNSNVTIKGTLSSKASGQTVVIERFTGGTTWKQRASGKTTTNGAYSITFKAAEAGKLKFRARVGSTSSAAAYLKVLKTVNLADEWSRIVDVNGFRCTSYAICNGRPPTFTATVNAKSYPASYLTYINTSSESIDIDLKRTTERFQVTMGVTDDSSSTRSYTYRILADGTQIASRSGVKLGQSFPLDLNVQGVLRLRIEITRASSGSGNASLALGTPRLTY